LLFSVEKVSANPTSELDEESATSEKSKDAANGIDSSEPTSKSKKDSVDKIGRDPIRWFGFSVPSTLRVAQDQFTGAIVGPIPRILHITKDMRQLENEIGRLRKTIRKLEKS
jgi:hypothetical protein